ncbi:MAG: sulfite exporter TauE/SafE family protein [Candidatus Sericytochromatia bacterium]
MPIALGLQYVFFGLNGVLAGLVSGLFGIGGGALVVPLLLLMGLPIHDAVSLSLVYILFTSSSGSVSFWRQQLIDVRAALVMATASALSVQWGLHILKGLEARELTWLYVGFMLLIQTMFLLREHLPEQWADPPPVRRYLAWGLTGLLAGVLSSLFGVGGGFIMVPLLSMVGGMPLKRATGTSLATVFLIALLGVAGHWFQGDFAQTLRQHAGPLLLMCLGGLCAAPWGVAWNGRLSERQLKFGFLGFSLLILAYMVFKALA